MRPALDLRPALEQGCRKQTPSASILFFRTNLVCVLNINMYRKVVHDFGTCKENAAAQCRLPRNFAAKHVFKAEDGTAQPNSL